MIKRPWWSKNLWLVDAREKPSINVTVRVTLPNRKHGTIMATMKLFDGGKSTSPLEGELDLSLDDALVPLMQMAEAEIRDKEKAARLLKQYDRKRTKKKGKAKPKPKSNRPSRRAAAKPKSKKPNLRQRKSTGKKPVKPQPKKRRAKARREGFDEVNPANLPAWEREVQEQIRQEKAKGIEGGIEAEGGRVMVPYPDTGRSLTPSRQRMREERPDWK